jgi:NADH-quinone oxidoreductase subunit N
VVLLVDLLLEERARWATSSVAGIGLLGAPGPGAHLAVDGADPVDVRRRLRGRRLRARAQGLFLLSGYVVVLLSTNYIAEGDYWEGEYYLLLLSSVLGMVVMASARDLISIFVALELLSIPAYMLAAWRKRDLRATRPA